MNNILHRALAGMAFCVGTGLTPLAAAEPRVTIVQPPAGALVPDAALDARGILHMVYGAGSNAFYVRSDNCGQTFSDPVKINDAVSVETRMGERGPKLALGRNGAIHVVWMDYWAPGVKTFVRQARSLNGGKSFQPPQTISSMSGVDGSTVAADAQGNVVVFWHVMTDPKPEVKAATWLHTARSNDGGATFGPSEKVDISNLSGLACSMCMMRARSAAGAQVYLAVRSAENSIRDSYILKGLITANRFTAVRVNHDDWKIDFCPMCGPELTLTPEGKAFCAFMTNHRVYWATSGPSLPGFQLHVPTPDNEENEIYPAVVANKQGDVLFVWQVGPMATKGRAVVKWALYDGSGRLSGRSGTIGHSFAGTKATTFVGPDQNFYIITTAQP